MAVSEATILKRVTDILNVAAAGTYSASIATTNLDRNADAINDASTEAAMMIGRAILSNPQHVHRNLFTGAAATLTNAAELPDMAGEISLVEIQPYSGASWQTGVMRDVQTIESYRANTGSLYDSIAHNITGSRLSGYYAIANGRFYFTGYAARAYLPTILRATVTAIIPDEYENAWVALTIGLCIKEGDNLMPIAQHYFNIGLQDLAAIAEMGVIQPLPPPQQAQKSRGNQ